MDRAFLTYYEAELEHLREMAEEFGAMHPTVARNLSLDTVPCPDPYVERLLEGVAFLGARTRLKLDYEATRHVRTLLDSLYPDLATPAPAMSLATLVPGPQVDGMKNGYRVRKDTRFVAGLREGLSTRAVYTSAQDVTLWPLRITGVDYLQDRGALKQAGLSTDVIGAAESGLKIVLTRTSPNPVADLALDRLDIYLGTGTGGARLFDAIFGHATAVAARGGGDSGPFLSTEAPQMVGISDTESLLPRGGAAFEGYRLLREYFLMPERFHYARLGGLAPAIRRSTKNTVEAVILFSHPEAAIADTKPENLSLFTTPLVNLFERECNIVELDPRRSAHVVHADRTRPRDFEIYRLLKVEDVEREGRDAVIAGLYAMDQRRGTSLVYATDRRPRRPTNDERVAGQMRTSYPGDDFLISVTRPPGARSASTVRRLDIRALCTNRDLPILDDTPRLTLETSDPIAETRLLQSFRRPRASLAATLPSGGAGGEADMDDLTWRWISQLSLNFLSLAEAGEDAAPLKALLQLYADRGDPVYERHARAVSKITSRNVIDRIARDGPRCFAHGAEITLHIDEDILSGNSRLLLSALLSRLFARHASVNSFVRTLSVLSQSQEEVRWQMTVGTRQLI